VEHTLLNTFEIKLCGLSKNEKSRFGFWMIKDAMQCFLG